MADLGVTPSKALDPFYFQAYAVGLLGGFLTFLSPCGFPLIPAYVPYFLGKNPTVKQSLRWGGSTLAGFLVTVPSIGIFIAATGTIVATNLVLARNFDLVASAILITMGLVLALRLYTPLIGVKFKAHPERSGTPAFFLFGVSWSLAALTCSAPIYISTLIFAFLLDGVNAVAPTMFIYALGMSLPILGMSGLIGTAREPLLRKIASLAPKLQRLGGVAMAGVGVYVLIYFLTFGV